MDRQPNIKKNLNSTKSEPQSKDDTNMHRSPDKGAYAATAGSLDTYKHEFPYVEAGFRDDRVDFVSVDERGRGAQGCTGAHHTGVRKHAKGWSGAEEYRTGMMCPGSVGYTDAQGCARGAPGLHQGYP